ncbi:hypothetical protein Tco_1286665 [Tanacetum coccineum]
MTESPLVDSGFAIPIFSPGDDPIACLNKAMSFLTVVASSRFPSTNNYLRTSLNPRNQATIQDGRVIVQQVRGDKVKVILEAGQILDEEQLAFLAYPGVPDGQAVQTIIPNNAGFQTEDLDTYDSDYDDISNNEKHSDSNITLYSYYLQETQQANVQDTNLQAQQDLMILSVIEQMSKQMINHVNNWEKANKEQNSESVTAELERYKEQVKTFEQRLNIDLSSREKIIDSQMDDMIKEKLALKE